MRAFPAVHIKPLDRYDYFLRFSGELLILALTLSIAGLNLFHFYLADKNFDKSFAAKFLSYHPKLNPKLHEKNSVITTKIVGAAGFAPLAQADDFGILPLNGGSEESQPGDEIKDFEGEVLVQPNPDTLESLIAKQIKVYKTQSGDTLAALAKTNGISVKTLMWANKLENQDLKPGWYLIILPTDGVLHRATSNNTLPDLAVKYKGNLETIISYNGLEGAEDIDEGQWIIIPGGIMPEALKPKPVPGPAQVNPKNAARPQNVNNGTGHIFPWGYCTWYIASKTHIPWGGNAKNWLSNAKAYGAVIGSAPIVGGIVVTTDNRRYGHVAFIESMDERGFTVSEMNYEKFGRVNTRWINKNSPTIRGYIYP